MCRVEMRPPWGEIGSLLTPWRVLYVTFLLSPLFSLAIKAAAIPATTVAAANHGGYHGNANDFVESDLSGFASNASSEALKERFGGGEDEVSPPEDVNTPDLQAETQVITQEPLLGGALQTTLQSMDMAATPPSVTMAAGDRVEEKSRTLSAMEGNETSDVQAPPKQKEALNLNGSIKNQLKTGRESLMGLPLIHPNFGKSHMREKTSDLWNVKDNDAKTPIFDQPDQDQMNNTRRGLINSNETNVDEATVANGVTLNETFSDDKRPIISFENIPMLNESSEEAVATTTERVLKWNIQNDTNNSFIPEIDETKYPVGKVCILLNGTVVRDMEEGDCKSNSGLHYKYIPSRLRNNGTGVNSTGEPVVYTAAPGEDLEDGGISPEAIEGDGANWEDAQWALYNAGLGQDPAINSSLEVKNSSASHSPYQPRVVPLNPLSGPLLNISENIVYPFEASLNASGYPKDPPEVPDGRGLVEEPGWTQAQEEKMHSSELTGHLGNTGLENANLTGMESKTNAQLHQVSRGSNFTMSSDKNATQLGGGGRDKDERPVGTHIDINDLFINKGKGTTDLGKELLPGWRNKEGTTDVYKSESESHQEDYHSNGQGFPEGAKFRNINPKFHESLPPATTQTGEPMHIYHGRPRYAIQGLIWEDRRYMMSVLVPVGCGMVGAFLIVCLAYLSRYCPSRQALAKSKQVSPQPLILDRVMLLADSSDEEEF